jgi:hypothetical protein
MWKAAGLASHPEKCRLPKVVVGTVWPIETVAGAISSGYALACSADTHVVPAADMRIELAGSMTDAETCNVTCLFVSLAGRDAIAGQRIECVPIALSLTWFGIAFDVGPSVLWRAANFIRMKCCAIML